MKLSTYCAFVERRSRTTVTSVLVALITILSGTFEALAVQGPPALISYQGYLANDGVAVDGENHTLTFRIYASGATTDATSLWTEEHTVTIDDGYFSVQLGDSLNVTSSAYETLADVFADTSDGDSRWIGIQVDSDTEITPRLQFLSGAYAFTAQNAVYADVAGAATSIEGDLLAIESSNNLRLIADGGTTYVGTTGASGRLQVDSNLTNGDGGRSGPFRIFNSSGQLLSMAPNEIEATEDTDPAVLYLNPSQAGGVVTGGTLNSAGLFTAEAGAVITGGLTSEEWAKFEGLVELSRSSEATVSGSTSGNLLIGSADSENLVFDTNEIQARNNGAASDLILQEGGGNLEFGNPSSNSQFMVHVEGQGHSSILSNEMGSIVIDRASDNAALSLAAAGLEVTTLNSDGVTRTGSNLNLNVFGGGQVKVGEGGLEVAGAWNVTKTTSHTMAGYLHLNSVRDAEPTQSGVLMIGSSSGKNTIYDGNEIMARQNGTSISQLNLNAHGGTVHTGGSFSSSSDQRLKRNIEYVTDGLLETALSLRPAYYNKTFDGGETLGPRQLGFIAQDVAEVLPALVSKGEEYLALEYSKFGVTAIGALQELKEEKDEEIAALRAELDELKAANAAIQAQLATVLEALPGLNTASAE